VGIQAAEALAHAHALGVVHRDIKPSNLLRDAGGRVWITDFGLVKTADSDLTATGFMLGTLRYLAPEQLRGQCDARSDIYGLGLTLYETLTLRTAFSENDNTVLMEKIRTTDPEPPRRLDPLLPRDLETIVLKAMHKDPARRYQRADDLAEDLRRFQDGEPIRARRTRLPERVWLWGKRHPLAAVGLGLFLLAILLTTAAALWTAHEAVRHAGELQQALTAQQQSEEAARSSEREAKQARRRAEGLRLVAQSERVRPDNPALALLLAVEAAERVPGLLANNAMQEAMDECYEERVFRGHKGAVFSASFSADGAKVLTCSLDGTARVWEAATGNTLHVLPQKDLVYAQISPDGRRVVTLAGNEVYRMNFLAATSILNTEGWERTGPRARLWDVETGREVAHWQPPRPAGAYRLVWRAGAAFSPDGRRVVTFFGISPQGHLLVQDAETGRPVTTLPGDVPVLAAAFSPDGHTLATAPADDTVCLWQAETGRLLHPLKGHRCNVDAVPFSTDGRRLLTLGTGKRFPLRGQGGEFLDAPDDAAGRVWDVATGHQRAALAWPGADHTANRACQLTPDGRHAVLADAARGLGRWDAATGNPEPVVNPSRLEWPVIRAAAATVALSPAGDSATVAGVDRAAHVHLGKEWLALRGHDDAVTAAAFSPDGRRLVTASADGTARLWVAPRPGYPQPERPRSWWPTSGHALSPDGGRLFVAQNALPRGLLLDTASDRVLARYDTFVFGAAFVNQGQEILVVGARDEQPSEIGYVDRLDAATGKRLSTAGPLPGRFLAASPDGRLLLLGPRPDARGTPPDGPALVWDLAAGKKLADLAAKVTSWTTAAFSPDGRLVTLGWEDSMRKEVWEVASGKECEKIRKRGNLLTWVAYPEGGRRVLGHYADFAGLFRTFDADGDEGPVLTDRALRAAAPSLSWSSTLARLRLFQVSPDGRRFACSPMIAGVVGVWDLRRGGEAEVVLHDHAGEVTCTRFVKEGLWLVTGAEDRTARLWDVESGKELAVFQGHEAAVTCASLDAAGKWLVTAGRDHTIRLWDVASSQELARLRWQPEDIQEVAFTPDGGRVVVRGTGLAHLWDLDILAAARRRLPRSLTEEERRRFEIPDDR
jgi:WD40 repeat protein